MAVAVAAAALAVAVLAAAVLAAAVAVPAVPAVLGVVVAVLAVADHALASFYVDVPCDEEPKACCVCDDDDVRDVFPHFVVGDFHQNWAM